MATRYRRDKQKQQIEGQTIQWPQDTDEINRSNKSEVRHYNGLKILTRSTEATNQRSDNTNSTCSFCLSRRYIVVIALSDLRFVASVDLVSILRLCIVWPSICSFCWSRPNQRSDNTNSTRYWRDQQQLQIEGQTIQWPQDTDEINRSYKSKVICCFCLSRLYLVAIVLSDFRFVASVYLVCIL
jgi:hypothetical protein